ncbi:MAG: hypothetical protein EB161_09870, partial [Nitrosopumilaceae archaeon]|nr:hypothetical protein [Nitrosopumilaceae archaeon]
LDAAVSSRLATTGLTSLQADVTDIKAPVVANLDAAVSSRLAAASYTSTTGLTSLQADVTAIKTLVNTNLDTKVSSRITSGVGAYAHTTTINRPDNEAPIEGVAVWVTSDFVGNIVVAGTNYTNAAGQVTFYLDTNTTYYMWCQKSGFEFSNPKTFTVSP